MSDDVLTRKCVQCRDTVDILADVYVVVKVTRIVPTEYIKKQELLHFYHEKCYKAAMLRAHTST